MKVVHFTNNDFDGAGKAVYRLHKGMLADGIESSVLVYRKTCDDDSVIQVVGGHPMNSLNGLIKNVRHINYVCKKVLWKIQQKITKPKTLFNFDIPFVTLDKIKKYLDDTDVICLYSVQSFLTPRLIKAIYKYARKPIVWTPLDVEPLTGGCHFHGECQRFEQSCGNCPLINSTGENDTSRQFWREKESCYKDVPIQMVATSSNVRKDIENSALFGKRNIQNILLGVTEDIFKLGDKVNARRQLNLPKHSKIILFGCFNLNDERKGGARLVAALEKLSSEIQKDCLDFKEDLIFLTVGRKNGFDASHLPMKWIHLGHSDSEAQMALIYQAVDVFACPSIDDNGPMMVNEAFASGAPIVAFKSGIAMNLVQTKDAGYLAEKLNGDDFAVGLKKVLLKDASVSEETKQLRKELTSQFQVEQYKKLFSELIEYGE